MFDQPLQPTLVFSSAGNLTVNGRSSIKGGATSKARYLAEGRTCRHMKPSKKSGVTVVIPVDIWEPLTEIRAQLDALCPGAPTPVEEALREVITHYAHCPRVQDEAEAFCERAKAWKNQ